MMILVNNYHGQEILISFLKIKPQSILQLVNIKLQLHACLTVAWDTCYHTWLIANSLIALVFQKDRCQLWLQI